MPYIKRARLTKREKEAFEESFERVMKLFPNMPSEKREAAKAKFLLTAKVVKRNMSNAFGVRIPPNVTDMTVEFPTTETILKGIMTTGKEWEYPNAGEKA